MTKPIGITDDNKLAARVLKAIADSTELLKAFVPSGKFAQIDSTNGRFAVPHLAKLMQTLRDSAGKRVIWIETEQAPNAYTVLNIAPSKDSSRSKISFWEKSLDSLAAGERPRRPLSIEAHSFEEGGEYDVSFYSNSGDGTTTESTAAKVFQWHWGPQWDNTIEFLTAMRGNGKFNPADVLNGRRVVIGYDSTAGDRPKILFGQNSAEVDRWASLELEAGVFALRTGTAGRVDVTTPEVRFTQAGGLVSFTEPTVRANGSLADALAVNGVYLGKKTGDQSQPQIALVAGGKDWRLENRGGAFQIKDGTADALTINATRVRITGPTPRNLGLNVDSQFGGGAGVLGIANAQTAPVANPTGGIVLYSEGGVLKLRTPSGVFVVNVTPA